MEMQFTFLDREDGVRFRDLIRRFGIEAELDARGCYWYVVTTTECFKYANELARAL
jgi:hypothetical protein